MSSGSNNSSNSNPRQVVIDDSDHTVHYKGSWAKSNGNSITFNHQNLQTVPYDNSLHGTQGDGSFSFSYKFNGTTSGQVMGFADTSNSSGGQDPTWECVLDGNTIHTNSPPDSPTDQFSFCSWETVEPGPHKIAVNVKSQGSQFFFDQITYVPDPHIPVKNATVLVGKQDDALMHVNGGPESMGSMKPGSRMAMSGAGSVVTFPFFGNGLSWYGKVKDGHMPTGFYSIDGHPPINFTVTSPSGNSGKGSSKSKIPSLFFKTPHHLNLGNHSITVTSTGDPQSSPLPLSYLVLSNGQLPQPPIRFVQTSSPSDGPPDGPPGIPDSPALTTSYPYSRPSYAGGDNGQANDSDPVSKPGQNFPYTQIIAALGSTLFLIFMAGLILCFRRRQRWRRRIESPESGIPIAPTPTGSSSRSAPPPYMPPEDMSQTPSEYPFAMVGNSSSNFAKRFASSTSASNARPNSLFASFRPLSPLPSKRISFESSAGSSTQTYRPYVSRPRSNTQSSTGSTATLLPNESISERGSEPPSRKGSLRFSFPDDQTVVEEEIQHKEGYMGMWHTRPPKGSDTPPPSDKGG